MAWRQMRVMIAKPSVIVPSLLMPLFFFTAFAGGLSAVGSAPNFDYPDYTTFQFIFVLMQSAVFGGVFTGFSIAADFETGFARRMLLATRSARRSSAGYALTAIVRAVLTLDRGHGRRAARRRHDQRQRRRHRRDPADRADAQLRRAALRRGPGDALPHPAGGAADPAARVPGDHDRARLRAARPDRGLGPLGRQLEPDDRDARGRPQPDHRRPRRDPARGRRSPAA